MDIRKFIVLLPARDEAQVLGPTLACILDQGLAPDQIHVVADHCQDATPDLAAKFGVRVWERGGAGRIGKGPAISWWLNQSPFPYSDDHIVVVLDADTGLDGGFFEQVASYFDGDVQIAQARIQPLRSNESNIALLASFSEIVEQRVWDALRHRWGWPVRLRGTGMAFQQRALREIAGDLRTSVEDIELTLLAAQAGYHIDWIDSTCIYDPKPATSGGASRQRARWLKGQVEILRTYGPQLALLMIKGPATMTLVGSLLFKPRTLFLPLKVLLAIALTLLVFLGQRGYAWVAVPAGLVWLNLALEGAAMMVGLRYVDRPIQMVKALLAAPLYGLMWLRSAGLALLSRDAWLRSRDEEQLDET